MRILLLVGMIVAAVTAPLLLTKPVEAPEAEPDSDLPIPPDASLLDKARHQVREALASARETARETENELRRQFEESRRRR